MLVTDTPSKSRRFSRRPLLTFSLLLILFCFFAWNLRTPFHDSQIEAIRALGYPITLKELDEWYRKPPDAENAALIYTNAFEKISTASNAFDQITGWTPPVRGQLIGTDDKEEFAALFATNREPLALLDSAVARMKCRYPIDLTGGMVVLLPHLLPLKRSVQILTVRAMLETANGDSEAAVRSFLSAGHLAASLSEEPVVISQLVECACWGVPVQASGVDFERHQFLPSPVGALAENVCCVRERRLLPRLYWRTGLRLCDVY